MNTVAPAKQANKDAQKDLIDVKKFVSKLVSKWYYFVISLIVCITLTFVYLRYKTPTYNISAEVLVSDDASNSSSATSTMLSSFSDNFLLRSSVDDQAQVLQTRYLMQSVVHDLNLNITYLKKGRIKSIELYRNSPFILIPTQQMDTVHSASLTVNIPAGGDKIRFKGDNFDRTVHFGDSIVIKNSGTFLVQKGLASADPGDEYAVEIISEDAATDLLKTQLTVQVTGKQVNTIDLDFTYPLPDKGEAILNKLLNNYTQFNIEDKNRIADSTLLFIDNRLSLVSKELGGIEKTVQDFKQQNKVIDISEQSKLLLANANQYDADLSKVETEQSMLNEVQKYVEDKSNSRLVPSSVLPADQIFASLIENYNSLLLQKDRLRLTQKEESPYVKKLNEQIGNVRNDILQNIINTKKSLASQRRFTENKYGTFNSQISSVPTTERQYLDLSRQRKIKEDLYVFLLQRREETAISKTSNIANSRVIDPPKSESWPSSPKRPIVLLLGVFMGLLIPVVLIQITSLMNNKIQSKAEVEGYTSVSIVGEITHSTLPDKHILVKGSKTPLSEQFRALRTNLQFYLPEEDDKVILVSSSMPGEGKSFVALNLASALALLDKKTVLLEFDLRKPKVSSYLGISNDRGLTNYLIGSVKDANQLVKPIHNVDNFYVIPSGPIPPNPAELMSGRSMEQLFAQLKHDFDYIVVDAPPVGIVTDALLLKDIADILLYIVRHNFTTKQQLNIVQELYDDKRFKRIAVVINDVSLKGSDYGYGYRYGYGYELEEKKKGFLKKAKV